VRWTFGDVKIKRFVDVSFDTFENPVKGKVSQTSSASSPP